MQRPNNELAKIFDDFLEEYAKPDFNSVADVISKRKEDTSAEKEIDRDRERELVSDFLAKPCPCGKNCQAKFSEAELSESRDNFRSLTRNQRNCCILALLRSFQISSDQARSAGAIRTRRRQRYEYRVNADRPVCRDTFLFYHGETLRRLKHLQKHLVEVGTSPPIHGNKGRTPHHACTAEDKKDVEKFIVNFAVAHGMPDPGRDLRKGKGKLRILLPSVLSYKSMHRAYVRSTSDRPAKQVGYLTFIRIWQEAVPHVCFSKPRSDLCMTCENFKKALSQIASDLNENREDEKIRLHEQAIGHLEHAKRERDHYRNGSISKK